MSLVPSIPRTANRNTRPTANRDQSCVVAVAWSGDQFRRRICNSDDIWRSKTVAVILPTYRERDTIRVTIADFEAIGVVEDILVVNNNAQDGTSEEVAL